MIYSLPVVRDGKAIGVRGILIDNTERERALSELKLSRERLELALLSANEAIWDWNIKTGELTHNGVWFDLLGYERNELENHFRAWESIVHPEDRPEFEDAINNHLKGRTEKFQIEHRIKTKDGEWKTFLTHGKVVERDVNNQPRRAIGTHVDITEEKRMEEILIESEKRALLGRLAGGVANELKNIMTSIEAYPDLIERYIENNSEIEEYLARIREAGSIGKNIVSDLIHLSHEQQPDLFEIDLNSILFDYIRSNSFRILREENPAVQIEFFPERGLPLIKGDQARLTKCIENLIKNSVDAIDIEGDVRVSLGISEDGKYVVLEVFDDGRSIPAEDVHHLFEPFYRGRSPRTGSGLRLALVKSTVEDHDGYVKAERKKDGNCFLAFFPVPENR